MSATGAYRILDSLEALFEPTVTVVADTPAVPVPDNGIRSGAEGRDMTGTGLPGDQ